MNTHNENIILTPPYNIKKKDVGMNMITTTKYNIKKELQRKDYINQITHCIIG